MLGKLPVLGRPTFWITVGQGPTSFAVGAGEGCLDIFTLIYLFFPLSPSLWETLAVGAGGGCLNIFTLIYLFFPLSPSLWETARYRLKYCLKGPLNPKQPTNRATGCLLYMLSFVCMRYLLTNPCSGFSVI